MILVGPFPPPIHGASVITERVAVMAVTQNIPVVRCNISPRAGSAGLNYHTSRARAYFRSLRRILSARTAEHQALYLSLSGGLGLWYDLFVVAAARLKGLTLIFHHHSFAYIDAPRLLLRTIVCVAGARQIHIVLCPAMAEKLRSAYGSKLGTVVVSNLGLLDPAMPHRPRTPMALRVIGYLSNISFEKGIDRYLDLFAALRAGGSGIKGLIAGPFASGGVKNYVERRILKIGGIDYIGPVHGDRKIAFFSSVDFLVFPSRYVNEAEPLVIYEALAAGIPVAASERGCVAQMAGPSSMVLLNDTASDLAPLVEQILSWEQNAKSFQEHFEKLRQEFAGLLDQCAADATRLRTLLSRGKAGLDMAAAGNAPPRR